MGIGAGEVVTPAVRNVVSLPGEPLRAPVRELMERHFGRDLDAVRIHDGGGAAAAARSVGATAFTIGHRIVFDAGRYRPETDAGRRLIAHELTHVVQQAGASQPALQAQLGEDEPEGPLTCTLAEMARDDFDERSCCTEDILRRLRRMLDQSREAIGTALERIEGGAAIDALLLRHFGPSGPRQRSAIIANLRTTRTAAEGFAAQHTFLCRPLSEKWGCRNRELALAGTGSDIIACVGGGDINFEWTTILHELFHHSGVADLPVLGGSATEAQAQRGEFETYYDEHGAESDDPRFSRYPSAAPLRNASSYEHLVAEITAPTWSDQQPASRFAPTLAIGGGITPQLQPALIARVAFTPWGRGLHFITPGAVGFWLPGTGVLDPTDPGAGQARAYAGGEVGARLVTSPGPVAGIFDLGVGAGAAWTRGGSVDPAAMFRASAGLRFFGPGFGVSVNADLLRIYDFALSEQRTDGWIFGLSAGVHWGGHSGSAR